MARNANGDMETELQFDVPDLGWVERWLATCNRDDVTLEPQPDVWQEDAYLDSESFVIYRAGFALRLRRVAGKSTVATLKALARQQDGPAVRQELEQAVLDEATWLGTLGPVSERV